MLCAIIFPSRGRPVEAERAIKSFRASASNRPGFRFLMRLDMDDPLLPVYSVAFSSARDVQVVVGNREKGWESGTDFCSQLADQASDCEWVWFVNDDMTVLGADWDTKLDRIPRSGVIVQPETHRLNASLYFRDMRSCAPCVPNGSWKRYGQDTIPMPLDYALPELLSKHGWTTEFLSGITIFHDRKVS